LDGKYKDLDGKVKKVNGDFTKVRFAVNLNEAGKRLLQNLEHTSRQLKGTMEVRKLMRYGTNAGRIRRGVPQLVIFSPDEEHNTLMIRLHRSRVHDPIHNLDHENKRFGARKEPPIDKDYVEMNVSCEQMLQWLPSYDERRAILSRDGLASVEGFKITILIVCEYIFGMRVCAKCPDCNHDKHQHCQDLFGNNAYSDGGAFGRAEGIYISIEAQKSAGSLHAHGQLHIECTHQHTPLTEIMQVENFKKSLPISLLINTTCVGSNTKMLRHGSSSDSLSQRPHGPSTRIQPYWSALAIISGAIWMARHGEKSIWKTTYKQYMSSSKIACTR